MRATAPWSLRLAPLLAGLLAGGCASTQANLKVVQPLGRYVEARVVAVYPFGFRWEEPPSRSLLLGMVAADALSSTGRLLVFGPSEFTVLRRDLDDPRLGTDLLGTLARHSLPSSGFVALRAWAEQRVERTSVAGATGGGRLTEQVTYVEHLELLDGGGGGVLLELSGEVARDASAAGDPYDPTPELTRLHRQLLRRAWEALEPRLTAPTLPAVPAEVRWLPAAAITWAPPGTPSLAERLAGADPVEADLRRLAVYRFVDPEGSEERLLHDLRRPGGLEVVRVDGRWRDRLRPGDLVELVGGEPATGRQVLQRAVALGHGEDLVLTVVRDRARQVVTIPLP